MRSRLASVLVWVATACGDDTSSSGGGGAGGEPAGAGGDGASETTGGGGSAGSLSTGGAGATGGDGGAAGADPTGGTAGAGGADPRCDAPGDCPTGAECEERTCVDGLCGLSPLPLGSPLPDPTTGDCQRSQCDGDGSAAFVPDDTDLPDDANPCTVDACDAGTPTHLPEPSSTPCGVDLLCDGAGTCVGCVLPSDCPGADTACATRTCTQGTCGVAFAPDGTPVPTQTAGDCAETRCDGAGAAADAIDDSDLPVDGLACTLDVCSAGLGSNPTASAGTPCTETGGTACNDSGVCVAPPIVLAVSPASGANGVLASTPIGVTFDQPMLAASLTAQTTAGPCTGALQVSLDDFASCVALDGPLAVLSGGGTIATITPRPGLLVNRTYRVRVTTAATSVATLALAAPFTLPLGFSTTSPDLCDGSLVVSQLYGGGGNVGAAFSHDFVELHNRGATAVSLDGLSLQYAPNQTTTWSKVDLTGTVPAGGYFLVQLQSNNQGGAPLPTPDLASVNFGMSMMVGKLALLAQTTPLPNGTTCPSSNVVDLASRAPARPPPSPRPPPPSAWQRAAATSAGARPTSPRSRPPRAPRPPRPPPAAAPSSTSRAHPSRPTTARRSSPSRST
jgi:hypothetical protein